MVWLLQVMFAYVIENDWLSQGQFASELAERLPLVFGKHPVKRLKIQ